MKCLQNSTTNQKSKIFRQQSKKSGRIFREGTFRPSTPYLANQTTCTRSCLQFVYTKGIFRLFTNVTFPHSVLCSWPRSVPPFKQGSLIFYEGGVSSYACFTLGLYLVGYVFRNAHCFACFGLPPRAHYSQLLHTWRLFSLVTPLLGILYFTFLHLAALHYAHYSVLLTSYQT